jgi:hypothetical protein
MPSSGTDKLTCPASKMADQRLADFPCPADELDLVVMAPAR